MQHNKDQLENTTLDFGLNKKISYFIQNLDKLHSLKKLNIILKQGIVDSDVVSSMVNSIEVSEGLE